MSPKRPTLRAGGPTKGVPMGLKGRLITFAIAIPIFLGITALLNLLVIGAIWPGEAKLFAPVICTDSHPDAYVVSDTYQVSDGTSTEFTVYCVADDGDAIDAGWGRAWFLGWVLHTVLIMAVLMVFVVRGTLRARRRLLDEAQGGDGGGGGPGSAPGGRSADDAARHPADRTGGEPTTLQELMERDFPTA